MVSTVYLPARKIVNHCTVYLFIFSFNLFFVFVFEGWGINKAPTHRVEMRASGRESGPSHQSQAEPQREEKQPYHTTHRVRGIRLNWIPSNPLRETRRQKKWHRPVAEGTWRTRPLPLPPLHPLLTSPASAPPHPSPPPSSTKKSTTPLHS